MNVQLNFTHLNIGLSLRLWCNLGSLYVQFRPFCGLRMFAVALLVGISPNKAKLCLYVGLGLNIILGIFRPKVRVISRQILLSGCYVIFSYNSQILSLDHLCFKQCHQNTFFKYYDSKSIFEMFLQFIQDQTYK